MTFFDQPTSGADQTQLPVAARGLLPLAREHPPPSPPGALDFTHVAH